MSTRPASNLPKPTGYWKTLFLLLGTARKRAVGRQRRQGELMRQRSKNPPANWGVLAGFIAFFVTLLLHGMAAFIVYKVVVAGQKLEATRGGKIIVDAWFKVQVEASSWGSPFEKSGKIEDHGLERLYGKPLQPPGYLTPRNEKYAQPLPTPIGTAKVLKQADELLESSYRTEAISLARDQNGGARAIEDTLREAVRRNGARDFITNAAVNPGLDRLAAAHSLPAMMGSIVLLWWAMMLVLQGEGLELDLQRRRHPMWEWLFAHPVNAGAIFTAEILSPIAANPIYWAAPVFIGGLYGQVYGAELGIAAALLAGVPIAVAAASLGKALEIGCILRFSPRSRGALIGLMSWLGYASMMLLFLGLSSISRIAEAVGKSLVPLTALPWPWLGLFLGRQAGGEFSFGLGMLACWAAAGLTGTVAVWFCIWGANQGLSGNTGGSAVASPAAVAAGAARGPRFGKEPLYRKELLWFVRDRSAIVQTILIPLTIAGVQLFNFRRALETAQGSWNYLCGVAVLFGTYFLWILGPKSLASEGAALWLALTWPRGLESLLKAKAWLWSMISNGVVALILAYAVYLFPAEGWKIGLVAAGWYFFGRTMAEKTVTLVSVTSSSGDPEPIPRGRRMAAVLGMLTFATGILSQQWSVAVVGIVYSYLTAAAMWENFRARLPFLYDPWSEKLPPPPTLMHAMVAVSILVEVGSVLTGVAVGVAGRESLVWVRSIAYAGCAAFVSFGMWNFLQGRGVSLGDVVCWRQTGVPVEQSSAGWRERVRGWGRFAGLLLLGAAGGAALGVLARGYMAILWQIPSAAELMRQSQELMLKFPGLRASQAVCAIAVAPFVEEYLFRGLLYRALDREWGGWRAVVGSAAFFAIYHPPLAWLPVGLLGVANAVLFKKTGRLAPAVMLHMAYNAVVSI